MVIALAPLPQRVHGVTEPLFAPRADLPRGLHVELRPRDGRTAFHRYESIPLEVAVSSSRPHAYSIELDYGWNDVAGAVDFIVSPGESVIKVIEGLHGYACCHSRRPFLTTTPEVFRYNLTDSIRFVRPGTYQVQYRSREVFSGDGVRKKPYTDRGDVPAVSNVITLTILPDDPEWGAATLKNALAILDEPRSRWVADRDRRRWSAAFGPQRPGTRVRRLPGPAATRYIDAGQALSMLDTKEGIRERVRRLQMPSERDWRLTKGNGYTAVGDNFVRLSTRPDLVAAALETRASDPHFGVQFGYVMLWIAKLKQREHPELASALRNEDNGTYASAERDAFLSARTAVLESLERALVQKTGVAREMTADAIQMLRREK